MNICDCVRYVTSQRDTGNRERFQFTSGGNSLIFQSPFDFNLVNKNGFVVRVEQHHFLINDWRLGDPAYPQEVLEGLSFQDVATYNSKIAPKNAPRFRNHHFSREMGFTFSHLIMLMGEMQKNYGHVGTQMVWDVYFRLNDWSVVK